MAVKFTYNPLLSAGLQQLQNDLADLATKNHSDLDELPWSLAGHTIDTDVDFNSNNLNELGNLTFGSDGAYDIASTTVGIKRLYIQDWTGVASALPDFRGIVQVGNTNGTAYFGGDNVFKGFYSQKTVLNGSTVSDNTQDYTNLYQGNSTYPYIDVMYNAGSGALSGMYYLSMPVRNGAFAVGAYDSTNSLGGGGLLIHARARASGMYIVADEANTRWEMKYIVGGKGTAYTELGTNMDFVPLTNNTYDLGSSSLNWKDFYLSGDVFFTTNGGGLTFGEIYVNGNSTADTVSTATWTQVTRFATNGVSNNTTPDNTTDDITITKAGKYLATVSISFSGDGSVDWSFSLYKNNGATAFPNVACERKLGATGDIGSISMSGIVDLAVNDTIEVWMYHAEGVDKNITIKDCTLSLVQVGG